MDDTLSSLEARPDPDLTGRLLGDYLILRRLGRGGMADVYLAEQTSLKRQVAFKVLKSHLAADATYLQRFQNEAQAAASLVHANIVQIYEVGCLEGHHFIAQEYVPGRNLKQIIDRNGPLDVRLAAMVIRQVSAALHLAGEQNIIHRDIKPENILLTPRGDVKVADFGLARVKGGNDNSSLTQDGVALGTPLYMSPEQVEGRPVDHRSDIYSLGVTAYHMLVGRPPFEGDTPYSIAAQHLQSKPERLESLRPDAPEALCRNIHRMLEKKPQDRVQTPGEVLRELRSLQLCEGESDEEWTTPEMFALADTRFEATQQLQTAMVQEARIRQGGRRRFLIVVLAIVSAFAVGGVLAAMMGPPNLLARSQQPGAKVERRGSPRDQYLYAVLHSSPVKRRNALESFPAAFPPEASAENAYYWGLAEQRLAELLIAEEDYNGARRYYSELAQSDEPQFQAYGLAGLANDAMRRGDDDFATDKLARLLGLWGDLPSNVRLSILRQLNSDLREEFDRARQGVRDRAST